MGGDGVIVVAGEALVELADAARGLLADGPTVVLMTDGGNEAEDLRSLEQVLEATAFACEVAARTCERAGASPPRLEELRR